MQFFMKHKNSNNCHKETCQGENRCDDSLINFSIKSVLERNHIEESPHKVNTALSEGSENSCVSRTRSFNAFEVTLIPPIHIAFTDPFLNKVNEVVKHNKREFSPSHKQS